MERERFRGGKGFLVDIVANYRTSACRRRATRARCRTQRNSTHYTRVRGLCVRAPPSGLTCMPVRAIAGVDVDKFDYIQRDCLLAGVKNSCEFQRFITLMMVLT